MNKYKIGDLVLWLGFCGVDSAEWIGVILDIRTYPKKETDYSIYWWNILDHRISSGSFIFGDYNRGFEITHADKKKRLDI